MDWATLASWVSVGVAGLALAISVIASSRKGLEDKIDKIAALVGDQQKASAALDNRVSGIERDMQHLPTAEDVSEMKVQLTRSEVRLESLDRETKSITGSINRIENYLLKGAVS